MGNKRFSKIELTKSDREQIQAHLDIHAGSLPACVVKVLNAALKGEEKFSTSTAELSLKLEMKIVSSSEKCNVGPQERKQRRKKRSLMELWEYHNSMAKQCKKRAKKEKKEKLKREEKRRKKASVAETTNSPFPDEEGTNVTDGVDDSDDEISDDEVESVEFIEEQATAGKNTDQAEYRKSNLSIYVSEAEESESEESEEKSILVPITEEEREALHSGPVSSSFDKRERVDFVIDCRWKNFLVETATNGATGARVTASTREIGPKGTQLTWQAAINVIISIFGYAIPMRRLEKMLHGKLSLGTMVNITNDFSRRFVPIYLHLCQALADAEILCTDDTATRVNEVTKWKKQMAEYEEAIKRLKPNQKKPEPPPKLWEGRISQQKKSWEEKNDKRLKRGLSREEEPPLSLFEIMQDEFGFESDRKKPGKGTKTSLHTTVVHGRIDSKNPGSRVAIYRTHFGCAGNFLDKILQNRAPAKKNLVIHGDMSAENRVNDPQITSRFDVKYAGCLSHARRPFFRYRSQDPDLCDLMLSSFAVISNVENLIDCDTGRNTTNTILSRQNLAKPYWEAMLEHAEMNLDKWSNLTPLGKGLRYIINNYENMTLYLSNPKLAPTNNDSENLLRWEALADATSFGCDSLEGRMRCDVIRSALATCAFGRVDARKYLLFILLASPELIQEHPEHYTPQAFASWLSLQTIPSSDYLQLCAYSFAQEALRIYSIQFT